MYCVTNHFVNLKLFFKISPFFEKRAPPKNNTYRVVFLTSPP